MESHIWVIMLEINMNSHAKDHCSLYDLCDISPKYNRQKCIFSDFTEYVHYAIFIIHLFFVSIKDTNTNSWISMKKPIFAYMSDYRTNIET